MVSHLNHTFPVLLLFCLTGTSLSLRHLHRHHHGLQNHLPGEKPLTSSGEVRMSTKYPNPHVLRLCEEKNMMDTVKNRIPSTIPQNICLHPSKVCAGNSAFGCGQLQQTLVAGYTNDDGIIIRNGNITMFMGCACMRNNSDESQDLNLQ